MHEKKPKEKSTNEMIFTVSQKKTRSTPRIKNRDKQRIYDQ